MISGVVAVLVDIFHEHVSTLKPIAEQLEMKQQTLLTRSSFLYESLLFMNLPKQKILIFLFLISENYKNLILNSSMIYDIKITY